MEVSEKKSEKKEDKGLGRENLSKVQESLRKISQLKSERAHVREPAEKGTEKQPTADFQSALERIASPNWSQIELPSNGSFYSKTVEIRSVKGWDEEQLMAMREKKQKVDLGSYIIGYSPVMKDFPVEVDEKVSLLLNRSLILDFLSSQFIKTQNKDAWRALSIPDRLFLNSAIYFFSYGDEASVRCEKHDHSFTHRMRPYFKIKTLDETELNRYLQTKKAVFLKTQGGIPVVKVSVAVPPNNVDLFFSVATGDKEALLFGGHLFAALASTLVRVEMDGKQVPITSAEKTKLLKGLDPDPLTRSIQAMVAVSLGRAYEGDIFYGFDLDPEVKLKCPTHGEEITLASNTLLAQFSF